jgi:nucleoside-diphosphate-sugar epimerase
MKILITGGGGHGAGIYRKHVGTAHELRLFDRQPFADVTPHEAIQGDLSDAATVKAACQGVEVVIHLGGDRNPGADFHGSLLQNNILSTYNVFAAAHEAGCRRVIFASSGHTCGAVPNDQMNISEDIVLPANMYGVSKCFGEDVARYYAQVHGLSCICLRIGWIEPPIDHIRRGRGWAAASYLSARDFCQLLDKSLVADVQFAVINGSSNNTPNRFDLSRAHSLLGYEPQDNVANLLQ